MANNFGSDFISNLDANLATNLLQYGGPTLARCQEVPLVDRKPGHNETESIVCFVIRHKTASKWAR